VAHSALDRRYAGHPVLKHIVVWQLRNRANKQSDGATAKHALDVYQQYPMHLDAKKIVGPLVVARRVVDYEV
jgi:hypothetical protein